MSVDRRDFLRLGLAGAAAGLAGCGGKSEAVSALTADGRLVRVPAEACCGQAPPEAAREGIAARKWVMVIDLAKCDG